MRDTTAFAICGFRISQYCAQFGWEMDESTLQPVPKRSMLCIDSSGLCLAATGEFQEESAGIYHNLIHMAGQLSAANNGAGETPPAVIRIETDDGTTIVKTYEAHTVVVHVPTQDPPKLSSTGVDTTPDAMIATESADESIDQYE